ncbi:MAG: ATP-grasp domain-containing protein, partial [Actinobacteria bacterium]|nr:ATP-grasp domain-containing protein [Actinomycetota bacterium]
RGTLDEYSVELLGASVSSIRKAEDRQLFREAMERIGLRVPESRVVHRAEEALELAREIGFPLIIRPSFTLGGKGGATAYGPEDLRSAVTDGLDASPVRSVLVERSVTGWKEFELEVMRDLDDNVVVICSIENIDPMGVHTGDSITVAPAQTLSDRQYQTLRNAALRIIREIGVQTGGSNIQFAVDPVGEDFYVIEMNPRVSRSSALASKATGFPIAKIAAKLGVGYSLDEIPNDITRATPASFEPALDYVVTKVPRFAFEKFPASAPRLTTKMHSVGEVMAIGRTFTESLLKALASLEVEPQDINAALDEPNPYRIFAVFDALRAGTDIAEIVA